jgi:hypothetical protein
MRKRDQRKNEMRQLLTLPISPQFIRRDYTDDYDLKCTKKGSAITDYALLYATLKDVKFILSGNILPHLVEFLLCDFSLRITLL